MYLELEFGLWLKCEIRRRGFYRCNGRPELGAPAQSKTARVQCAGVVHKMGRSLKRKRQRNKIIVYEILKPNLGFIISVNAEH